MNLALIVAAGRGYRLGGAVPKQYLSLGGEPVLRRTVRVFLEHPEVDAVQVLIHPNDQALYDAAVAGLGLPPALFGGATRQESVRLGLEGVAALEPRKVLIQDAVRPFVPRTVISGVLAALEHGPAALTAVPLADTLKRVENGVVTGTVDRANLYRAQTPQGFRYAEILAAHRHAARDGAGVEFTDDAMIAEYFGLAVTLIAGSEENFKITTAQDLQRAGLMLGNED